jgi:hypothetical protein
MNAEAATFPFPFQQELYELFDPIFSNNTSLFSTFPGRGYPLRTSRHQATTSFLVAGSYMGIEPSVIPEFIWSYLLKKLNYITLFPLFQSSKFEFNSIDMVIIMEFIHFPSILILTQHQ